MANIPTVAITEFGGLRNKQAPQEFGLHGMVTADNMNIDAAGKTMFVRRGQTLLAATAYRGAFSAADKTRVYAVTDAGVLEDWTGGSAAALRSGFVGYPYWTQIADIVFVGNEHQTWRIFPTGKVTDNALQQPSSPQLTPVVGTLPAGQYRVVVVSVEAGRESAPSDQAIIEVDGTQDILVSDIQGQRLYVAPANAQWLYYWCDTTATTLVYGGAATALGEELETRDLDMMPDGRCLASYQKRLYNAVYDAQRGVSSLSCSLGSWWDLADSGQDVRIVLGEIRAMYGLPDGLVIGTDRNIWVMVEDEITKVADYGVPPGEPFAVDEGGKLWLATRRGFASALPFTEVATHFELPDADWSGSAVIRQDGDERFIVTVSPFDTADNTKPAAATADIEILVTEGNEFLTAEPV